MDCSWPVDELTFGVTFVGGDSESRDRYTKCTESKVNPGTKLLDKLASPSQDILEAGRIEKSWPRGRGVATA